MLEALFALLVANPTLAPVTIGVIVALRSLKSQQHLTRAKHTLDFDVRFKTDHVKDLLAARLILQDKTDAELKIMGAAHKSDDPGFKALVSTLNVWEHVGIGLRNQVYDEHLLKEAYGSTVIWLWIYSVAFIRERQRHNPRVFVNFDWLALRWLETLPMPSQDLARLKAAEEAEKLRQQSERATIRKEVEAEIRKELAQKK